MIGPSGRQDLDRDGGVLLASKLSERELGKVVRLADRHASGPGGRIFDPPADLKPLLSTGALGAIAADLLGEMARPVRILLFDKTPTANWAVPWHQDRTIAVQERNPRSGFETWTTKSGVPHVEPPFDYIASMISLRLHLDDCGGDNGPLKVIPGSHRLGRLTDSDIRQLSAHCQALTFEAARGDVLVLRTSVIHASDRATNPARRRVLHVDFSARDLPEGLEWAIEQI